MSGSGTPAGLSAEILARLPVAAISQAPSGAVLAVNAEAERVLGIDRADLLGRTLDEAGWDVVRDDGAPLDTDQLPVVRVLATGAPVSDILMGIRPPEGELRWFRASAEPEVGPSGAPIAVLTILTDVTVGRALLADLDELTSLSDDLITRHDLSGRCTWASMATRSMFGLAPRDVVDTVGLPRANRADTERLLSDVEQVLDDGLDALADLTWRAATVEGEARWIETRGRLRRDAGDEATGFVLFHRDVTERRKAEATAKEAERRFRAGFDHAPIAMKLLSPSGRIVAANAAFSQLTGRSVEEIVGHSWEEFVHPDDIPAAARAVAALIMGTQDAAVHHRRYVRPDGSTTTGIHHLTAVRDDQGDVVQLFSQIVDVTEATRSEDRLRASEARLAAVLTAAPDGIVVIDEEGTIESFSESAERIFGWTAAEAVGAGVELLMPEQHGLAHQGHIERYLRGSGVGMVGARRRLTGQRADGSSFPLELSLAEVAIDGRRWFTGICRDVTEEEAALARLTESEERFRSLADASPVGIFTTDADGSCTYTNPRWQEIYGLSGAEALGPGWSSTLHPDDATEVFESWNRTALSGETFSESFRLLVDDEVRWVRANARPVVTAGRAVAYIGSVDDITVERRALEAMVDAEERFRAAFEQAPLAMVEVRSDGVITSVNEAFLELCGPAAPLPVRLTDHTPPEEVDLVDHHLETVLSGAEPTCSFEHRIVRGDGSECWMLTQATGLRTSAAHGASAIVQMVDMTGRRELEERLRHLADHDPLTGLANRRAFTAALEAQLEDARRYGASGAVAIIDLDNFKALNDTAGHAAGDDLLRAIAAELRAELRADDVVARLGGDEFAILLPVGGREQAEQLGTRITDCIQRRAAEVVPAGIAPITASVGIALVEDGVTDGAVLLHAADESLYAAKRAGRNRFELAAAVG